MYKYDNNQLPPHMDILFPDIVGNALPYNLRNSQNYATIARPLDIYSKSFIPSAVKLWNELDISIRSSTLLEFKRKLKLMFSPPQDVPRYYIQGDRFCQDHLARIRNHCSNLNADLFNNHLKSSAVCACDHPCEDAEHYFFCCTLF